MIYKYEPNITTIVLHHTAVSRNIAQLQFDSVNTYHKNKWGMESELGYYVGYNFFVEATGLRTQTRKIGEETIAQIGNNCDSPDRCGMISYCMAGDFSKEKPTEFQVADFKAFVDEVKLKYPNVVVKQHKDVAPGRTCAQLTDEYLQSLLSKDDYSVIIAKQEKMIKQLIELVTLLLALKK